MIIGVKIKMMKNPTTIIIAITIILLRKNWNKGNSDL